MSRFNSRAVLLAMLFTLAAGMFATPWQGNTRAAEVANLKDQLEKGLRATRPKEIAFIDKIVRMVETNQLPRRLVNAAFSWSRNRRPSYPFPYFVAALRVLASREGIQL